MNKTRRKRRRCVMQDGPDPIDVHVGIRVRLQRTLLGMSQTALSKSVGVSFQQIQKYERGTNRLSASTLYRMAEIFDVPVSFFFDEMPASLESPPQPEEDMLLLRRESLDVLRGYNVLSLPVRKSIRSLITTLGQVPP